MCLYLNCFTPQTPNSGLTRLIFPSSMTAYKNHDFDPVLLTPGDSLVFRAFEQTGGCGHIDYCPDKFCLQSLRNSGNRKHLGKYEESNLINTHNCRINI